MVSEDKLYIFSLNFGIANIQKNNNCKYQVILLFIVVYQFFNLPQFLCLCFSFRVYFQVTTIPRSDMISWTVTFAYVQLQWVDVYSVVVVVVVFVVNFVFFFMNWTAPVKISICFFVSDEFCIHNFLFIRFHSYLLTILIIKPEMILLEEFL